MKKLIKMGLYLTLLVIILVLAINIYITQSSNQYIYKSIDQIPEKQAIIVLGAYVRGDNLSLVLEDRVKSAILLYDKGKSNKMLLSGDHGRIDYDEVNRMKKYVLNNGKVNEAHIFLDHAGFDTYDSMYRAKAIFGIENAIIVTQDFHINRAVYIARQLGIDAVGYSVDQTKYVKQLQFKWTLREYLSRVKAFVDVILESTPKYLGDPIPISGDGRLSWDEFED